MKHLRTNRQAVICLSWSGNTAPSENGQADWPRLETEDETQGFLRSGLVTFFGPTDFAASEQFGIRAFWLRARWLSGAYDAHPRLRYILTNTMWAAQRLTTENEILGSSTGDRDQVFHTTRSPILPGQLLEVLEPSTIPEEPEGGGENLGRLDIRSRTSWHQVPWTVITPWTGPAARSGSAMAAAVWCRRAARTTSA